MGGCSGPLSAVPFPRVRPGGASVVVAVFLVVIAALLGLGSVGLEVLAGVRAFVGGEGLWSKAEKDAAAALSRYVAAGTKPTTGSS